MADLAQLESALVKADAAGDAEGARILAAEVRKMRATPAAAPTVGPVAPASAPPTSLLDRLKSQGIAVGKGLLTGGPVGAGIAGVGEGMKQFGQAWDKLAYNAGGAVTDALAGKVSPEVAGGAGYAANVATQAVPVVLGAMAGKAAQPAVESAGKGVMQSALKPSSTSIAKGDAAKAIQTMLDEGVNVTPRGVVKLRMAIDKLNSEIVQKIATSPEVVDKGHAASEVFKTLQKFRQQVTPGADTKAILGAWEEFTARYGAQIPIQEAQALKQGTYKVLAGKYGEVGSAATEAQKALARGLRKGIEERIPEIAQLNAKESNLIKSLDLVERRVGIGGNKDIGGLAWIANNPAAAAAFMAGRSSLFKSIVARMLYSGAGPATTAAGATVGAIAGAASGSAP